ncbi:response regulator [Mucilaginibacter sp. BJC16-A38]|uniref:ATP-binding protein n=1 Tax=Mucilaginibacter phenanthrenivorans TaxID=1234842 RepID=UPI0021584ACF|nr:ATP-binding protein [Mucilaginibacter phenanthrenivorans]MCR8560226.1 response regulator [Mucilaginibacter phenanthrenivorans]
MGTNAINNYSIASELHTGFWEWNMQGQFPFDNPALMEKLGYLPAELSVEPLWIDKISGENQRLLREQIDLHINSHAAIPFTCEVYFNYKNINAQCYFFSGKIVQWAIDGTPLLMLGSYINITSQRQVLGELNRIKSFLSKANLAAKIGAWEIDIDTLKVNWTQVTREIFGVDDNFVPEKDNFIHFFKKGDDDLLNAAFHKAIADGTAYDLELEVINAKGEELWTRTIGQPEFEDGRCTRVYGIFQDITKQKTDEEKLRIKQAQLEAFISAAPTALAMLDRSFNYIAASKIWMKSYNIDVATIIGKNHLDIFYEISEEWKDYMRRCLHGESFRMEEDPFIRRDGKQEWLRWEIKPWYETPDRVGGIILFTELVTEKKLAQQELIKAKEVAENALQAKSRFLSVMSHEIRTPMNAVIGFSNLLLQDPREDQQEYLKLLKFSADNLMVIINDILSLSKIDEGMVSIEQVDFSLRELLENISAINRQAIVEKKIDLKLNFDARLPLFIKGDTVRLGQVITNLLNNAVKFTSEGEVAINVEVANQNDNTVDIYFEIKDTGIGIAEEKQEYIFEIFTQESTETTRKFGGIGLGLAICRKLVQLMGGDIKIKSKIGEGSAFYFTLPFKKGELQKDAPVPEKKDNSGDITGKRILLAEDNPINVLVVKRYLQKWGVECDVAENGQVAVQMLWAGHYDMILMDLQMPVMDGYDAARQIRLTGGSYASIPIVSITASLVGDIKQSILAAGMNDWVSKPFNPDELFNIVKKYTVDVIN